MIATAVAEKEAQRLDEGHIGERDADARRTLGAQPPDEGSIDNIIEGGGDHRNDGRHRHLTNQPLHRPLRHLVVALLQ